MRLSLERGVTGKRDDIWLEGRFMTLRFQALLVERHFWR
jgi:hypothetical protein